MFALAGLLILIAIPVLLVIYGARVEPLAPDEDAFKLAMASRDCLPHDPRD